MKKNKVLSFLLAGSLLVGGTFVGTKALFSDTKESKNSLTLSTGKVSIRLTEKDWVRNVEDKFHANGAPGADGHITTTDDPYNKKYEQNSAGEFKNVQPGDTFTKYISVIANESTYDLDLNATLKDGLQVSDAKFKDFIEIDDSSLKAITQLEAGKNTGGYITVKIKDNDEAWKAFNGADTFNIDALYEITATQAK